MRPIWKHEQPSVSDIPREEGPARTRNGWLLLFAIVAGTLPVLLAAACGNTEGGDASAQEAKAGQEPGERESALAPERTTAATQPKNGARGEAGARAGEAVSRGNGAQAGEVEAGTDSAGVHAGEARVGKDGAEIAGSGGEGAGAKAEGEGGPVVRLRLTGDPGTDFSGTCSAGGTERKVDGRVPERYVFAPGDQGLRCELRADGGGALGIFLTDGAGVSSEQRTTAGQSTLRFTYRNGSVTSTTSSTSGGRSVTYSEQESSQRSR
jgi:hypothetical protein